jgi:Protein of unknown function (DUF3108)
MLWPEVRSLAASLQMWATNSCGLVCNAPLGAATPRETPAGQLRANIPVGIRTLVSTLLAFCLVGGAAQSQTPLRASYEAYVAGLNAASVDARFLLEPDSYRMELSYETAGVVGFLMRGSTFSVAEGTWRRDHASPRRFRTEGTARGKSRITAMDYLGGQPLIRRLVPPNEGERETVPPGLQANSVDPLSALAELIRTVHRTGRCEGAARVYDGRRASEITARTVGEETLPPSSRSVFAGRALRCDFVGHMTAGFNLGKDKKAASQPLAGSAWLAEVTPGTMKIPTRVQFETRWFGHATLYLTAFGISPDGRLTSR